MRGKTYRPYTTANGFTEVGVASWYGPGFHGKKTANGERYNQNAMTAAHKLLPFNTDIRVTNLDNGRSTVVRINDRGPFVANRVIDLSRRAAEQIDMIGSGTARVRLEAVNNKKPVLTPDGQYAGALLRADRSLRRACQRSKITADHQKAGVERPHSAQPHIRAPICAGGAVPLHRQSRNHPDAIARRVPGLFVVAE